MRRILLCAAIATVVPFAAAANEDCAAMERRGDPPGAIRCFEGHLAQTMDPQRRASILIEIAWLHWRVVQFERALADFRQVIAIAREVHDRTLEARAINFSGLLYQLAGDNAAALDHYNRALPMAREAGDRKLLGEVLYHLGWLHFTIGEFKEALPFYEESLRARRDSADAYGEAVTLLGLGMTHTSLGELDRALPLEEEALSIARAIGNRQAEADALDHLGTALTLLHRPEEAIEKHSRALELRRAAGAVWATSFSLGGIARAQHEMGHVREAASTMAELIEAVEGSRRNLETRRFRGSVFARVRGHYDRYITYLMELHDSAAAFAASEQARARLTLDAVQDALARADAAAGGTLLQREDALQNAIERAGANVGDLLVQFGALEEEIRRTYPKLAAARDEAPMNAPQIQSELLEGDTAIIEYALLNDKAFAWVLTPEAIAGYELGPSRSIRDAAVRLHSLLSKGDRRTSQHEVQTLIDQISAMVIAPLAIPRVTKLLIVPDGPLFYVPFAALHLQGGTQLLDRFEITMAPSASASALMRKASVGRVHDDTVAVFADPVFSATDPRVRRSTAKAGNGAKAEPLRSFAETGLRDLQRLPATRSEAEMIIRLASGHTRKVLDFAASRDTVVRENLGRYRVVHFATHAVINAERPDATGIVLSLVDERGAPVNGFLRIHDLYTMNVTTDLVVLSACRTAMGKELRGEGIVGLVNAFMHSGAPRVIASYWDVKDEATAELMQRFYRALFQRRLPPAAALRAALLSMRSEARWRSPYYWAAFAIFGAR